MVALLTSEIVSNAVVHAALWPEQTGVQVDVTSMNGVVRVDVHDCSRRLPVLDGVVGKPSGRGLLLVDTLASRWGVVEDSRGKVVWFEVVA